MNLKSALRWAAMYRAASWLFGLVFLGFLGVAYLLGLGQVLLTLTSGNPSAVVHPGSVPPVALALAGFLVWQLGKTAVFYKTTSEAVEEQLAHRFDSERVKSEILSVLDDRLSEMQSELEQTRREVGGGGATTGSSGFDFEE